jgi:hypothetical protein
VLIWVTGHCNRAAVSRNRYGVEKTVDTHKILINAIKFYVCLPFNFTYRYIDDVLSINNLRFAEFLPLMYSPELGIKETTDTASSASF